MSQIVSAKGQFRFLFEPFHPRLVASAAEFRLFHYLRPGAEERAFDRFAHAIFSGQFRHRRVDMFDSGGSYDALLVKDIFANLLVGWVDARYPSIRKVMILRHPFAVALSKQHLAEWHWMTEPADFLDQPQLVSDFLKPFSRLLLETRTFFERQVLIWCIVHFVPLQQLSYERLHVVFYEQLWSNPTTELQGAFKFLGFEPSSDAVDSAVQRMMEAPSVTSVESTVAGSITDRLGSWQTKITNEQVATGLRFLREFGLDRIYNEDVLPKTVSGRLGAGAFSDQLPLMVRELDKR